MADAKKPLYVNFQADAISPIDHSKVDPGGGDGKVRAGYTSMILSAKLSFVWSDPGKNEPFPFFAEAVNVFFFLKDIRISISKSYAKGSCPYKATLQHEMDDHALASIKLFYSYRDNVVRDLTRIKIPSQAMPKQLTLKEAVKLQDSIEKDVANLIKTTKDVIAGALKKVQKSADSAANYKAIWAKCLAEEWE
jgi:hypothetical protein